MFGRRIGWGGQARDDHSVPLTLAVRNLWPHTLLGGVAFLTLALTRPEAIPYAFFWRGGPASGYSVCNRDLVAPGRPAFRPSRASAACLKRRHRPPR